MSKSEVKPREFYIWFGHGVTRVLVENDFIGVENPDFKKDCTHVVEMSAYDFIKKENEEMKDKLEQLDGTCQNLFDLWQNSMLRENELKIQVEILKKYKAMYEGLCK